MTKEEYLKAYEAIVRTRPWATDKIKLAKFMDAVRATLYGERNEATLVGKDASASNEAWKAIGCKGKPTYKALRALP